MLLSEVIEVDVLEKNMFRANIHIGDSVDIVLKADQGTSRRVHGTVKRILTNNPIHTRGIKVELEDGQVGRVQSIVT